MVKGAGRFDFALALRRHRRSGGHRHSRTGSHHRIESPYEQHSTVNDDERLDHHNRFERNGSPPLRLGRECRNIDFVSIPFAVRF